MTTEQKPRFYIREVSCRSNPFSGVICQAYIQDSLGILPNLNYITETDEERKNIDGLVELLNVAHIYQERIKP